MISSLKGFTSPRLATRQARTTQDVSARIDEAERWLNDPTTFNLTSARRKAAATMVLGSLTSFAAGGAATHFLDQHLAMMSGVLSTFAVSLLAAGATNAVMQEVPDKTNLQMGMCASMIGALFSQAALLDHRPLMAALTMAGTVAVNCLVAHHLQTTRHGLPARVAEMRTTMARFEELQRAHQQFLETQKS